MSIGGIHQMATATKKKSKSGTKLQPLGDRVVVARDESEEKTAGGILLPDSAKDKPARGKVVSMLLNERLRKIRHFWRWRV